MKIKFQLDASFDQLEILCKAVETLQESLVCSDRQLFEIVLILEELCANVIRHGDGKLMEVELSKELEELIIIVNDDGAPFDPTEIPEVDIHQPLEERSPGGLGIHLVHHYTDSIIYRRENEKNIVTMTKVI